jgi:N-acyl-L-homoserine lactone synthetase
MARLFRILALRKRFFVDQLGWDIPHDDQVEMDQYDNPKAYYSLVLRDGKVIGGMRAMATTAQWGAHTYMLRDAVDGKLIGIPADIIPPCRGHADGLGSDPCRHFG